MVSRVFDHLPEVVSRVDVRYGRDSTLILIPSPRSTFAIIQEFVLSAIFVPILALTSMAGLRGFINLIRMGGIPVREIILAAGVGLVWTALSIVLIAGMLYGIVWRLWGEERIHISYERLTLEVRAGWLRRRRSFSLEQILSVRSRLWEDNRHFSADGLPLKSESTVNWFTWSETGLILIYEPLRGGKPRRVAFGRELTMREQSEILVEIDKYRFPEIHWGVGRR